MNTSRAIAGQRSVADGSLARYDISVGFEEASSALPVVVTPQVPLAIGLVSEEIKQLALESLQRVGAVLFRGFRVTSPLDFKKFAAGFGAPLKNYDFGSTPRSRVLPGIYSSTEYPAHQGIPLHNEQSYTCSWPEKIWFYCMKPSLTGGETPIADSRDVYARISTSTRQLFEKKQLLYVRHYSPALDVPWQQVFDTHDRGQVERYCDQQRIEYQWIGSDELRTRQRCQAVIQHPVSQEPVWFNQAHLFHISALEPPTRANLLSLVGEEKFPRNVYFGDGTAIDPVLLEEVRAAYRDTASAFPWRAGDILMLDNMLVAHGRNSFTGDRKVVVAMA